MLASGSITVTISNGTSCSGKVGINYNNTPGYLSAQGWDLNVANVVCKSQGCGFALSAFTIERVDSAPVWFEDFHCIGTEYSLSNCLGATFVTNVSDPIYIAGVTCSKGELSVRLTNGTNRCNGILEVSIGPKWKRVCADNKPLTFASVVCRELLCGQALSIQYNVSDKGNTELFVLNNINCYGNENYLSDCESYQWHNGSCNSSQEVTIACSGSQIASGANIIYQRDYCTGNVAFAFTNNYWYFWNYVIVPVVAWDIKDAKVVCRQRGCGFVIAASTYIQYGHKSAVLDIQCNGTEGSLSYCPQSVVEPVGNPSLIYPAVNCSGSFNVRISNGSGQCSGSISIWYKYIWSPLTADGWDINAANVVCRSQGCGFALAAVSDSWLGTGSVPSWLNNFQCSGTENYLSFCSAELLEKTISNSSSVAGVICSSGEVIVRLVNGTDRCNGILEVNVNSSWERACSDNWHYSTAAAVCRELFCGYSYNTETDLNNEGGQDGVWLNNVNCYGYESALSLCPSQQWTKALCKSQQQIRISCSGGQQRITSIQFAEQDGYCSGKLRFSISYSYYYQNTPVTEWDIKDANTACRQMGCGFAISTSTVSVYGRTSALLDVQCKGNESYLENCLISATDSNGTRYENVPYIKCSGYFNVRIVDGMNSCSGRVEVYYSNTWTSVSVNGWDINDANVICRSHGCGFALTAVTDFRFGVSNSTSNSTWLTNVQCVGSEFSLSYCYVEVLSTNTVPTGAAGVICSSGNLNVRLVNGTNRCNGKLEVSNGIEWGAVCNNYWNINHANAVCSGLKCGHALSIQGIYSSGEESSNVLLSNAVCYGWESSFSQCTVTPWVPASCNNSQMANITCSDNSYLPVRLVNGPNKCSGRVEVYYNSQWGTVCDDLWDINDARVVCKQIGCGKALSAQSFAYFGMGSGPITLDNVQCRGNESNILECSANPLLQHDCSHIEDAGVTCEDSVVDTAILTATVHAVFSGSDSLELLDKAVIQTINEFLSWIPEHEKIRVKLVRRKVSEN
ncbi:deleted in malignant brain tumors 1 protein-like [Protopterus annectens]|uniref:deleted in malignant brain tumors 1 protein-like n=1 Tax=Protopterus annectens TaxID=7888 RepID=UPI001CF9F071|nr:deleted in malignant brain tumors 1 protein-like [Protopterus annectens]